MTPDNLRGTQSDTKCCSPRLAWPEKHILQTLTCGFEGRRGANLNMEAAEGGL